MPGFTFHQLDISDKSIIEQFKNDKFDAVINLAARAGVRSSVKDPWVYLESNTTGTLNMLDLCRVDRNTEVPAGLDFQHLRRKPALSHTRNSFQRFAAPAVCGQQKRRRSDGPCLSLPP